MPLYNSLALLLGYAELDEDHNHSIAECSSFLEVGKVFTSSTTSSWVFGNYTEIIAANAVTSSFDIHFVNAGAVSDVGTYQMQIAKGTAGSEERIATCMITRLSNQTGAMSVPVQTPLLPANTRVSARIASNVTNCTLVASVQYHKY